MSETTLQTENTRQQPRLIAQELTIERARNLLDWLEAHGIQGLVVKIDPTDRVNILLKSKI